MSYSNNNYTTTMLVPRLVLSLLDELKQDSSPKQAVYYRDDPYSAETLPKNEDIVVKTNFFV